MSESTQKSWLQRNLLWVLPAGCLSIVIAFVGLVAALTFFVFATVRSHDIYRQSLALALADPRVIAQLGQPIETGWYVLGQIDVTPSTGDADLIIPIHGSKASGQIFATAKKSGGDWVYSKLSMAPESGREINLLATPDDQ
jgi:Cytochrome oxidase complex assembly protein 1